MVLSGHENGNVSGTCFVDSAWSTALEGMKSDPTHPILETLSCMHAREQDKSREREGKTERQTDRKQERERERDG